MLIYVLFMLSVCFPMDNLPLRIKTRRMMAADDLKTGSRVAALAHFEVSNYYVQHGPKLIAPVTTGYNATGNVTISAEEVYGTLRYYLEEYLKKRREQDNDF